MYSGKPSSKCHPDWTMTGLAELVSLVGTGFI